MAARMTAGKGGEFYLREQNPGNQDGNCGLGHIMHTGGDTCPPAQQDGGIGSAQISAARSPQICFFPFGKVVSHIGAAQKISQKNSHNVCHRIYPFVFLQYITDQTGREEEIFIFSYIFSEKSGKHRYTATYSGRIIPIPCARACAFRAPCPQATRLPSASIK